MPVRVAWRGRRKGWPGEEAQGCFVKERKLEGGACPRWQEGHPGQRELPSRGGGEGRVVQGLPCGTGAQVLCDGFPSPVGTIGTWSFTFPSDF